MKNFGMQTGTSEASLSSIIDMEKRTLDIEDKIKSSIKENVKS